MAPEFTYEDLLPIGPDTTEYRLISNAGVSTFTADGKEFLKVSKDAINNLTQVALHDISHYLRSEHLGQLASILTEVKSSLLPTCPSYHLGGEKHRQQFASPN